MVTEVRFGLDWSEDELLKNYAELQTLGYEQGLLYLYYIYA